MRACARSCKGPGGCCGMHAGGGRGEGGCRGPRRTRRAAGRGGAQGRRAGLGGDRRGAGAALYCVRPRSDSLACSQGPARSTGPRSHCVRSIAVHIWVLAARCASATDAHGTLRWLEPGLRPAGAPRHTMRARRRSASAQRRRPRRRPRRRARRPARAAGPRPRPPSAPPPGALPRPRARPQRPRPPSASQRKPRASRRAGARWPGAALPRACGRGPCPASWRVPACWAAARRRCGRRAGSRAGCAHAGAWAAARSYGCGRSRMGRPWKSAPSRALARPPKGRTLQPVSAPHSSSDQTLACRMRQAARRRPRRRRLRARQRATRSSGTCARWRRIMASAWRAWRPALRPPSARRRWRRARARLPPHRQSRPPCPAAQTGQRGGAACSLSLGGPSANGAAAVPQADGVLTSPRPSAKQTVSWTMPGPGVPKRRA